LTKAKHIQKRQTQPLVREDVTKGLMIMKVHLKKLVMSLKRLGAKMNFQS
jgi:hypothetical protein